MALQGLQQLPCTRHGILAARRWTSATCEGAYRRLQGSYTAEGSCETALSGASGAACLADASQPMTQRQAALVFMNRASNNKDM